MAYSMPPAEVLGTFAGIASGELGKSFVATTAEAFPVAGEVGRAVSEATAAAVAHYLGAASVKGLINLSLGDLFGLCMNTTVTSPTSAAFHGMWVLLQCGQAGKGAKPSSE